VFKLSRRDLLRGAAALSISPRALAAAPPSDRPAAREGLMTGDVLNDSAVVWSRADRPSRMWVSWGVNELGDSPNLVRGPLALPKHDLTGKLLLSGLPADSTIALAVRFEDLRTGKLSDPVPGQLRTAPRSDRDVRFVWSADLSGQGWGIDVDRGGYTIFDRMRARDPDFFLCSGDRIYADGPLEPTRALPDGTVWNNLVTPARSRVAETLDDFRGCHRYNHLDVPFRQFHAQVPTIVQWDDHEVVDNWQPDGWVRDPRYTTRDMNVLAQRARQALAEYTPTRTTPLDWARLYRRVSYGPLLDVFVLDTRSYRGPNGDNQQALAGASTAWLGRAQQEWLKHGLARSTAVWKVVACPQPLGTVIWHDWAKRAGHDGLANSSGPPLGREHEIAHLLHHLQQRKVRNVVWLAADVHYAAAHHYHPDRAVFQNFDPFWEFVTGPLHAGTFGPNPLDDTFGPEVSWQRTAPEGEPGLGPAAGLQFFGEVHIAGGTRALTVRMIDAAGAVLHTEVLLPHADTLPK
jgi:alkaline phosphatase D